MEMAAALTAPEALELMLLLRALRLAAAEMAVAARRLAAVTVATVVLVALFQ
jgi:hypothetical protein